MKKLLLTLTLVLATLTAGAQNIFNNPDNHRFFGVRLGLDVTCPTNANFKDAHTKIDVMNSGAGFSVGAIYQIPVFMNLYVEPGVGLYYHTAKFEKDLLEDVFEEDFKNASLREFGLTIPVMVGYHFDFGDLKVAPFTGPVFNVGLKGRIHVGATQGNYEMSGSEGAYGDGGFNRGDVAWRFGASVTWGNIMAQIYGDAAMTNALHDSPDATLYRNNFTIGIGYNF